MANLSLLKLLQLSSPTLPVGAFAYSQGLESAIENELVIDVETLQNWLIDCLCLSLKFVDLPLFSRLYKCWCKDDVEGALHWNQILVAQRETRELRDEDHHLGTSLARLLSDLDMEQAKLLKRKSSICFLTPFSLAACKWQIAEERAAHGFVWSWLDNQIAAAIKLVPLGQTDGQRVLSAILPKIPLIVSEGLALPEEEIGASLPMLAILSSQHETQYSRLFRS